MHKVEPPWPPLQGGICWAPPNNTLMAKGRNNLFSLLGGGEGGLFFAEFCQVFAPEADAFRGFMVLAFGHDGEHDVGLGDVLHQLDRLTLRRGAVEDDHVVAVVADAADVKRFVTEGYHGCADFLILVEAALEIGNMRHQLLEHTLRRRRHTWNRDIARHG